MRDIGLDYYFSAVNTLTPFGTKRKKAMQWYGESDCDCLVDEWNHIDYFSDMLEHRRPHIDPVLNIFCLYRDITPSVNKLNAGITFDDVALFEIKKFAILTRKLIDHQTRYCSDFKALSWCSMDALITLLDPENEGLDTFYIYNAYSKKLANLRQKKEQLEGVIKQTTNLDKRSDYLKKRRLIVDAIDSEEYAVRKHLTMQVAEHKKALQCSIDNIAALDHWLAKAKAHRAFGAVRPTLNKTGNWAFKEVRNPYFEHLIAESGGKFQPIEIVLKQGTTLLSGANMGGKTVALKTLYLNALLVHLGYYPAAQKASGSLLSFITFIGYEAQNVRSGLSSFASEFHLVKQAMAQIKSGLGMIIMDEPARGTNPKEGRAIVRGLARTFNKAKVFFLMSSHFDDIVEDGMAHYQIKGISQLSDDKLKMLSIDDVNYVEHIQELMDYTIIPVDAKTKIPTEAIKIIELLGLDASFVEDVKKLVR